MHQSHPTVQRLSCEINDHHLSFLAAGDPSHPVVLFIHGIPASAELWRDTLAHVADHGYYCIAPDLPGYGKTCLSDEAKSVDYSLIGAAKLLLEWCQLANLNNIWLVAHDIGGGVAQIMLAHEEQRFTKATLSNCITDNTWPVASIQLLIWLARIKAFVPLAAARLFPNPYANFELHKSVVNRAVLTDKVKQRIFWDSKTHTPAGRLAFQKMLQALTPQHTQANMAKLAKITLPVHLIWALDDPNQPWQEPGRILAKTLPHCTITKLAKTGHFLQIDNPEAYLTALLSP